MEVTGVTDMADRGVDALSGGERQRVWLATCLCQQTSVLLLDEPTTYLAASVGQPGSGPREARARQRGARRAGAERATDVGSAQGRSDGGRSTAHPRWSSRAGVAWGAAPSPPVSSAQRNRCPCSRRSPGASRRAAPRCSRPIRCDRCGGRAAGGRWTRDRDRRPRGHRAARRSIRLSRRAGTSLTVNRLRGGRPGSDGWRS
ncbi:MAG: ATP-binding cassette domain-containing protein [Acidimicrobiia bacterium]|nr:ATP-binding cassette domain-containing protein [Acidimicrobiia bacterium]